MGQRLIVPGRMPSRNEAEQKARTHWAVGAKLKKQYTEIVMLECKRQKLQPVTQRAVLSITFYEQDKRRDSDNVISGLKYILDGMIQAGVLKNDTRKHVELQINPIEVDRSNPRIEVVIEQGRCLGDRTGEGEEKARENHPAGRGCGRNSAYS